MYVIVTDQFINVKKKLAPLTRRFVMKKINKEFEELMFTKTEGRMIEQLTVSLYMRRRGRRRRENVLGKGGGGGYQNQGTSAIYPHANQCK